jgi:hypothetical protein
MRVMIIMAIIMTTTTITAAMITPITGTTSIAAIRMALSPANWQAPAAGSAG